MISLPIYKDVKKMSNVKLVLEKEAICKKLSDKEKEKMADGCRSGWKEDESIIYARNIDRLEAILFEIKTRLQKAKWIFEEAHNFDFNPNVLPNDLKQLKEMHNSIFLSDIPVLMFTEVPEDKLIKLLQRAIYVDFKPLTLEDLSSAVDGKSDIID